MSANVIFVIVGIALILLALGISVWVLVLPMLLRLKPSSALRSEVLASILEKTGWRQITGPLFWKFVGLFLAVVCVSLLGNSLFEIIISYRDRVSDPHSARAGGRGRREDWPLHQGDREPDGLDDTIDVVGQHH